MEHDKKGNMNATMHTHGLMTKDEIRQSYDKLAPDYSQGRWVEDNLFGLKRLRTNLLRQVSGKVLDVACGTGENFPYFKTATDVTAIDLSPRMLESARTRANNLGLSVDCRLMDAETLEFPDQTFDTVVSSLSTCTFPDAIAALREMRRVCKPDGQILLLEHGRSKYRLINAHLNRNADKHYTVAGCRWNQEPRALVEQAGLRITGIKRAFFGIFNAIEASPR
jgi:ubiquinone/menaquinone biosynthesis C-methylase UbiE